MNTKHELATGLSHYAKWRQELRSQVTQFKQWLDQQELNDAQIELRLQQLLERLDEDKLNIAFVAEFSRGKSELINAIFFADYGQRLLPSSAGRTTMCPTELKYDQDQPASIQLLPIETRTSDATISELKKYPEEWKSFPLDMSSAEKLAKILGQVSLTRKTTVEEATRLGLYHEDDEGNVLAVQEDGSIEIPVWRHAVINYPHPLLAQGLVILDTPGLNAIGTEPELSLNLLPNAHAVLFILAADTGVTKSDIDIWRNYIVGSGGRKGRMAVLNKIDGLWDELKSPAEVDAEITKQVLNSAQLLGLDTNQVYPVSAQKALVAKVNGNSKLLEKSRLPLLERALSEEVVPAKQEILSEMTGCEMNDILRQIHSILHGRITGIEEQMSELSGLRGKNQDVIDHMMQKVRQEKELFEKGLQRFQALRSVFSQQTNQIYTHLGGESLKKITLQTREEIEKRSLTAGIRKAMEEYFQRIRNNFTKAQEQISETHHMMGSMYQKFSTEHGLESFAPIPFSMLKYEKELDKLERSFNEHFNTLWNIYSSSRTTLERKFFDTVVSKVKQIYKIANQEVDNWLKAVMAPMESQVREHQLQLKRRMDSIKRIHKATDTLEDRIEELEQMQRAVDDQLQGLTKMVDQFQSSLTGTTLALAA